MDKIYVLMTSYDDGTIDERLTGDWIETGAGYFSSFTEAKAEAKKVIKERFGIDDDHLISESDDGYGWRSNYGKQYGYFVYCEVAVIELKAHIKNLKPKNLRNGDESIQLL